MNLKYHVFGSDIQCPYCDKECYDDGHNIANNLESKIAFECEHCGKTFWANAGVCYHTDSDCKLNYEEHDWEASETHPTVFHCKECSQTKVVLEQKGE